MVKNKDSYHHGTLFSRIYKIFFYILSPRKNIGCFRLCGGIKNKLLTNQQYYAIITNVEFSTIF